ncbi:MAG TPA: M13 family metallopeptidase [Candidatus Kapabacteria bacterium]|jgi:predicted metalloendopeptidase|nr:M13 family metallopeptidase [Candidatus Kapabacteria bacterium]
MRLFYRFFLVCCSVMLLVTAVQSQGFDSTTLSHTCKPCEDFYKYVNEGYLTAHPIPPEYSAWGPWTELYEHNISVLHTILDKAAADAKSGVAVKGSNEQKIGDFYASALDSALVEHRGLEPLRPELDRIERIHNATEIIDEIAYLQRMGVNAPFAVGTDVDAKNSDRMFVGAWQAGLGLPDREYYFKSDEHSKDIRKAYQKHIQSMLELSGESAAQAARDASSILPFETTLARASMTRAERRDPDSTYHDLAIGDLNKLTPHFEWTGYLSKVGAASAVDVNVEHPQFMLVFDSMLVHAPVETWKAYFKWHLLSATSGTLPHTFEDEAFNFGKLLRGAPQKQSRWKRSIRATDNELGEALGAQYVKVAFPPEAKQRMMAMIGNLKAALHKDLSQVSWISDSTRQRAIAKLDAFSEKVGYPDKWRDYSTLTIEPGKYFENTIAADRFEFTRDMNKLGKPVDRTEWGMTPPTINAYYNSSMNEIVFPAGILQPPFFDFSRDEAYNYGAIGTVIGHEMTHGFDDNGAKFDGKGNLRNWWSESDMKNFKVRSQRIIDQFNSYTVQDSIHVIGAQVVGESIADLGGVTLAYAAMERSLEGKPRVTIDGWSPEQRFFLGYARQWAENVRPEYERMLVNVDVHPPDYYRVIGPLSNFAPFAKAFGCQDGSKMVRSENERCEIW